jgi:lysophospholipase L1-like esterase
LTIIDGIVRGKRARKGVVLKVESNRRKGRRKSKRGVLLPFVALVMIVAACVAVIKVVINPALDSGVKGVSANVSSVSQVETSSGPASSVASSSSPAASSATAASSSQTGSSAVKTGSYDYFADAVFIGDSLTQGISDYSVTKNAGVFASNAMSVSSARTQKINVGGNSLLLADAVSQAKPAKVYILLGANDLSWMSRSAFISDYGKLITALKAAAPDAVFYVQSVFPVSAAYEKSSGVTNDKIDDFNGALSEMCAGAGVKYVDVGQALKGPDGKLAPEAASAGCNISRSAYKTWLDYLTVHE